MSRRKSERDFPASGPWADYLDGVNKKGKTRGPQVRGITEKGFSELKRLVQEGKPLTRKQQFLAETFSLMPPKMTKPR